ncbi:hypothetical protein DER45DRAFT_487472 [Fusarium avenaceum]|nr:hypothetical protein DER45DRAFT_487472 [Fusarium avenaceum]
MYDAPPLRHKKTNITRSRTGCLNCRTRRKKCDEKWPCSSCQRLGKRCQQPPKTLAFRAVNFVGNPASDLPSPCLLLTNAPSPERLILAPAESRARPMPSEPFATGFKTPGAEECARTSGQLFYYYDVWNTHCVPVLHPVLREISTSSQLPVMLRDALLALAACQLSRMKPQQKPFDFKTTPGLSFRPDTGHQAVFCEKYGSTLLQLSSWKDLADTPGFNRALTGMILLAHLESLMGDFRQFGFHAMGVGTLLGQLTSTGTLPAHSTCQLIATWTQARAQNWWLRFHYSTPEHHRRSLPMESSPWLASVLKEAQDSRSVIMAALCKSCRLASVAFLSYWDKSTASEHANNTDTGLDPPVGLPTSAAASLRATLDSWHDGLSLSDLPIETFVEPPPYSYPSDNLPLEVKPLRFTSHQCAMNYAYYALSRLLLCSYAANSPDIHQSLDLKSIEQDANSWGLLLTRIAAGLNWDECLRLNRYVIGFSSLFLPAVLHSSDSRIGFWLQDWIEQRYASTNLEEGCFPVLQVLQPLRTVNREYREGRQVRAVFTCSEDEGGGGKYSSYNSQDIASLLVYSHDCVTGQNSSHTVWL